MFKIYITVKRLLTKHYSDQSDEYKKGWRKACEFMLLGIKNSTLYNQAILNVSLEKKVKALEKTNVMQRLEITRLLDKIERKSLLSTKPLATYNNFLVEDELGSFEIITNMDVNAFKWCLINFRVKTTYNRIDECKSKLLAFINSNESMGYRAFKDRKAYNRFLNGKT